MNKLLSILLPHSDDELFILPFIEKQSELNNFVKIFFITTDMNSRREAESRKCLGGFKNVDVYQLGILNNILDGKLCKSRTEVFPLLEKNSIILASDFIVSPIIEGGHVDHDEVFKISYELALKLKKPLLCFSLYNSYSTLLVRVATIFQGPVKGRIQTFSFSFTKGLYYLKRCFNYKSQFLILAILLPGLIRTFLVKRKIELLEVTDYDASRPHPGSIFYSNPLKLTIKKLLRLV